MNVEDLVEKNSQRPGYDLVDYAEAALPVYRLLVDAVTIEQKPIPPIGEFAMRCMILGMQTNDEIGRFLGLSPALMAASISSLIRDGLLRPQSGGGSDQVAYAITKKGQDVLTAGGESRPQDESFVVGFDGLLRKPVRLQRERIIRPAEVQGRGLVEIRPYPAAPPEIGELMLGEVSRVIKRQGGSEFDRDVLALKRISRRDRLFRHAIALIFRAKYTRDIEVGFVVDELVSRDHEAQFAMHGGPKKMGFIAQINSKNVVGSVHRVIGDEIVRSIPSEQELEALRIKVATNRMRMEIAEANLQRSKIKDEKVEELRRAYDQAVRALAESQRELKQYPIRPVAAYEFTQYLWEALRSARSKLIISTPRISPAVIEPGVVQVLSGLVGRGVKVMCVTGQAEPVSENVGKRRGYNPLRELLDLSRRNHNFHLRFGDRSKVYWLVKDNDFVIVSNFPWLAFKDSSRQFQMRVGYIVQEAEHVQQLASKFEASRRG